MTSAAELIAAASKVVVLSGAGLSTSSGIPDFRGPAGTWTRDPEAEKVSTLSHYLHDDAVRRRAWQMREASAVWTAVPNAGHLALVELERQGRLRAIVTQNTDGLHQLAGSDPRLVFEIHGSVRRWRCEDCRAEGPMIDMIRRLREGDDDPRCEECGGITRATTILFEEAPPTQVFDAAIEAVSEADLLWCVGTSLGVYPVAGLVPLARDCGATIVICNGEPTPYDPIADAVVGGNLNEVMPALIPQE